jgi:hypothetical protein
MCQYLPFSRYISCLFKTGFHYVAQAGLKTGDLPASASPVPSLQVCTTTLGLEIFLKHIWIKWILKIFKKLKTKTKKYFLNLVYFLLMIL